MSNVLKVFRRDARPESVRECLLAYYRLLDGCKKLRADYAVARAPLAERVALASVEEEIHDGISAATEWLQDVAERGGQGLPPPGGQEPQAKPGASMAHGCAALASSGRTRAQELPAASAAVPADRLFSAPPGQELPGAGDFNDARTQTGGQSCV